MGEYYNKALLYVAAVMSIYMCIMSSTAEAESSGPAGAPGATGKLLVQGRVYCDPCKVQFETRLSEYMAGAKVRLQCKKRGSAGEPVTMAIEEVTNKDGVYSIPVDGDHAEEICEVQLMKSGSEECKEMMEHGMEKSRVVLTSNAGMDSAVRFANSLGFMKANPDPQCPDVLAEMGFLPATA